MGFLDDLKKAVDTGEFNSEAAKKVIEVEKKADIVAPTGGAEANLEKRLKEAGIKTVTEEEATFNNTEYDIKMKALREIDMINKQIATITEIEDMVTASIKDMLVFTEELKEKFGDKFEAKDPKYVDLLGKINEVNMKFNNSIINN